MQTVSLLLGQEDYTMLNHPVRRSLLGREELHVEFRRNLDNVVGIADAVDRLEQFEQGSGRFHPGNSGHGLAGIVEQAVGNALGQIHHFSRKGFAFFAFNGAVEFAVCHAEAFVLIRMEGGTKVSMGKVA